MNATSMAKMAYTSPNAPIRTPRGTEYDLFSRITRRLHAAAADKSAAIAPLATAIHENRRLWATLAGSVANAGNELPDDLRARLFYLAEFTELHSRKVLRGKASVAALVEVNTAIMRGLADKRTAL